MNPNLVPRFGELVDGELVGLALDFLHRQYVCARAVKESDDAVDAGADGVDVPGSKSHGVNPSRQAPGALVRGLSPLVRGMSLRLFTKDLFVSFFRSCGSCG
ncbi:Uncharacterised protein [Chlamydia trachomatis]|nr:Uncharacterised protein [Chlamydia trachomatis]